MNHELALELRNNGFPYIQKKWKLGLYEVVYKKSETGMLSSEREIVVPLEELIEACGEDFNYLHKASAHTRNFIAGNIDAIQGEGNTPRKAVARLWLALNKK